MFEDKSYSDANLANLPNDKFVAVGSSLPCIDWLPLPVDGVPAKFNISVEDTEKALLSSKLHSSAGPDEISAWLPPTFELYFLRISSRRINLFLHCGGQQILHQFRNVRLQYMLIPTLDRSLSHRSLVSLCTAVTLDETRERTSVSWMHNPCSGHVDSSQIWGPASDWTVLYLNNL